MKKSTIKEGGAVWIPCEIKNGMFPTERYIRIVISEKKEVTGFVPNEDVKQTEEARGRVRAVIARVLKDNAALLFRGDILSSGNPVVVPANWLSATADTA